jgi:hypothetical protein
MANIRETTCFHRRIVTWDTVHLIVLLQLISTFARLICSLSRQIWWASSYTLYTCTILFTLTSSDLSTQTSVRLQPTPSIYVSNPFQAKNFMFMYELDMAPQSSPPRTARRHNANHRLYFRRQTSSTLGFSLGLVSQDVPTSCLPLIHEKSLILAGETRQWNLAHFLPSRHYPRKPVNQQLVRKSRIAIRVLRARNHNRRPI